MVVLLEIFQILPIVYAAALEFRDVSQQKHLVISLVTAGLTAVPIFIASLMAMIGGGDLSFWGIQLPQNWSLLMVVIASLGNFIVYWLTVGVTKLVEALTGT